MTERECWERIRDRVHSLIGCLVLTAAQADEICAIATSRVRGKDPGEDLGAGCTDADPWVGQVTPGDENCYYRVWDGARWVTSGNCVVDGPAPPGRIYEVGLTGAEMAIEDRGEFRRVLSARLQAVGDALMRDWEARRGG